MVEKTYLYNEIVEQPQSVRRFLDEGLAPVRELASAIRARGIDHVVIAARGTSDNAGRYAKYVLGAFNQLQVSLATPSLFTIYQRPVHFGNALVLGISQSGQSPDIVAILAEARRQGKLTAAITNTPNSPLAQQADYVIDLLAGVENAVAATKTYTGSLAAIAALSAHLAPDGDQLLELQTLPEVMSNTLQVEKEIEPLAQRYRYMERCVVIGRGFNYATAFELALKLKELTYAVVEPYSSADFLHGPFAMLERGFPVIVLAPQGALSTEMGQLVEQIQARGAEVLAISDEAHITTQASLHIRLPQTVAEWLSPLTAIMPGQMLAMFLAATQGNDVDAPRGIHKVTETT